MIEAVRALEPLETLKAFNNAIIAIRVYPASAPQITTAVERSYKMLKQYLLQRGPFAIAVDGTESWLCNQLLAAEKVQSIANLVVYRQLQLLNRKRLVIPPGFDRQALKIILTVFAAKVDTIKEEGGGREFIRRLQLDMFFPEEDGQAAVAETAGAAEKKVDAAETVRVRRDFLEYLLGRNRNRNTAQELIDMMRQPDDGGRIAAAGLLLVAQDCQKRKSLGPSPALPVFFNNANRLISPAAKEKVALVAANLLLQHSKPLALCLLLSQQFATDFGEAVFTALTRQMPVELYGEIVKWLRNRLAQAELGLPGSAPAVAFISAAVERLQATAKGRQYLGHRQAMKMLADGESERRQQRTEAGLIALRQGKMSPLQSTEVTDSLPAAVARMIREGQDDQVIPLLRTLVEQAEQGQDSMKRRLTGSIALIGESLVGAGRWDLLELLAEPLQQWLEQADEADGLYEKSAQVLYALFLQCLEIGSFDRGDQILAIFYRIRSGALAKPPEVKTLIGRVQDRSTNLVLLSRLLDQCLAAPTDEGLSRRLVLQGPLASRYMVNVLIRTEKVEDRIKIIDLLTYGEQFLAPILTEKLAEPMPWYGKRNLLKLLAETGDEEHLVQVYPFLRHEDLRVQREAFLCIYRISGSDRKAALLHALTEAGENLKQQIVRALQPYVDLEVVQGLALIIEEREHYSAEVRDGLLVSVCRTIGHCPHPDALVVIRDFLALRHKRAGKKIDLRVWLAAEAAEAEIVAALQDEKRRQTQVQHLRRQVLHHTNQVDQRGPLAPRSITGFGEEEEDIRRLVERGSTIQAQGQLLDLLARMARQRRFGQAEQLREWLISIDPHNLGDSIRAAEIIEQEKEAAIDKGHLEIWAALSDRLTTEEFSTLYHSLSLRRYSNEEIIAQKGDNQTALFFINSGRVKVFYPEKRSEILVKTMGKGEILGTGTFFEVSVWTLSAASLGRSEIASLDYESMQGWRETHPGIEAKLRDFCQRFETVDEFFRHSNQDRRRSERFKREGKVVAALLDDRGKDSGVRSRGSLIDLSLEGVSFCQRLSSKSNARLLLGRELRCGLVRPEDDGLVAELTGTVVAVRPYNLVDNEYSVHLDLRQPLAEGLLAEFLGKLKSGHGHGAA